MTKEIPELNDLTKGINDPDITPTGRLHDDTGAQSQSGTATGQAATPIPPTDSHDRCWRGFLRHAETADKPDGRSERLVCKLDRDLADSLDDCDIKGRCRSDLVNAIVRSFFETYLPRLAAYRREKKSLFNNYRET